MPSQAHHCNAGGKSGCAGTVVSGQNCSKCHGYSQCENSAAGCSNYVNVAGKTCPSCIAKAEGDAKRAKEAEKKKNKGKRELESREFDELAELLARDPEGDFMGESLISRSLDTDDMGIFARGLDAHVVPHGRPLLHPVSLISDDPAHIGTMPYKSSSGLFGFFFGVAVTLSIVMVYGYWRRFRQRQQYMESITRS
ncbi:hypothetical protein BDZ94DRAFT_1274628 [Collybia nuda]|uniref:Uncharacterized protein n=1 Tax=Collybia nuda TaxID=64659 RepID=A0A9P5XUC3_9AGAR|nr:hypothetical protein BDZ94DRAFT_1274628 [Collybia nuda]